MRYGIISGMTWGLDTVVLGIALAMGAFAGAPEASMASAFLHDAACALVMLIYMGVRGRLRHTLSALKTRSGKAVMGAAVLGGPLGMSGYLIAINNIGPGYTAIISSFYPAVGTVLAFVFLKERMKPGQVVALLAALAGVMLMGWTSTTIEGNAWLGIIGALMCMIGWGSEAVILAWGMRDDAVDNETALQIRETTSALTYALIVAPLFGVLKFSGQVLFTPATAVIALAGLAGTISYLFYYKAIDTIGAARGMALNVSYSAWAVVFGLLLMGTVPGPVTIICCVVVLVGTVLAATSDWNELRFGRKSRGGGSAGQDAPVDAAAAKAVAEAVARDE